MQIQQRPRGIDGPLERLERDGFAIVRRALTPDEVGRLTVAVDREYAQQIGTGGGSLHLLAFCGRDAAFLELLDHPATLPVVAGALGPNVFMYHCHLDVHPPEPRTPPERWTWHQDGGVVNRDLESDPRPRLSVKVAYFLSDCSEPGRGNFVVLPRSHVHNAIERPADASDELPGAVPVLAGPGDAVVFDRRLWHMRSPNRSDVTRKALFYAYTYRWVRARDDLHVRPELLGLLTPVRTQLLGGGARAIDFWMPDLVDLPVAAALANA